MQVREFILKNGIKKIKGLEVIGFDQKETIRVTKQDIFLLKEMLFYFFNLTRPINGSEILCLPVSTLPA